MQQFGKKDGERAALKEALPYLEGAYIRGIKRGCSVHSGRHGRCWL